MRVPCYDDGAWLEFDHDGNAPPLVQDQWGTHWMLIASSDRKLLYHRVACVQATLTTTDRRQLR